MLIYGNNTQEVIDHVASNEAHVRAVLGIGGDCIWENPACASQLRSLDLMSSLETGRLTRTPLLDDGGVMFGWLVHEPNSAQDKDIGFPERVSPSGLEDQFSMLNGLMANMLSYTRLDPLLQHIADIATRLTDATNTVILLVDETEEYLTAVASAGFNSSLHMGQRRFYGKGFAGVAWSTKKDQYLENCDALDVTKDVWPPGSQLVALPLMSDTNVIGVAVLSAPSDQQTFKTVTAGLIRHLTSLAGVAIVNARSKEHAELELSRMRALREISSLIHDFETPADLVQSVSKCLMHAMDVSRAVYFMVENDGVTEHADVWQKRDGVIVEDTSILDDILHEGLNGWVYRHNTPAYLPRNQEDIRESERARERRKAANIGSTLAVPICVKDSVLGVISISRDVSKRDLNENEQNLFISICAQISTALHNRELDDALKHRAFHDSLTELPNRFCFEKELKVDVEAATGSYIGAVLFLDLDGFKSVNDSMGHHYGDKLLKLVASRLKRCTSDRDTLARIGGDEFAVIARALSCKADAQGIASRIIDSMHDAFDIGGSRIKVGASIGISFFPCDGDSAEMLIRNADHAMYRAKAIDKGSYICFDQSMADESAKRIQLERDLREAIRSRQFTLFYQPKVDVQTGVVKSVEALIRWVHPTRGLVPPNEFIPMAEAAGLIHQVGAWVIQEAAKQLALWQSTSLKGIRIAVNIAASQFTLDEFSDQILTVMNTMNVPYSLLEIEVTESIVMSDIQLVISTLERLRSAGVTVSVDDFGTGYSSLSYLQDLPLDVLKIDRSFITRLDEHALDKSVVNTVMLLAKCLNLETVAEGVETQAQFDLVKKLGCNVVQGYFFAKPCEVCELPQVIENIKVMFEETIVKKAS